jgi:hypothetical protein
MRRLTALLSLAVLLLLLANNSALSQNYEEGELLAWQAIAETYYTEEGLANENFFFEAPAKVAAGELDERWSYRTPNLVQPGMFVPDFTLLDMEGNPHSLSDYRGEKFVLLFNGSWY